MSKNIHVTMRADGNWQGIRDGGSRASFVTPTQKEASHVLPSVAKEAAQKIGALVYEAG